MSSSDNGFLLEELTGVFSLVFFEDAGLPSSELLSDDISADKSMALGGIIFGDEISVSTLRYLVGDPVADEEGDEANEGPREGALDASDEPSEAAGLSV
jgi:hypothetical protein